MDFLKDINDYIACEIEVMKALDPYEINRAINTIIDAQKAHKRIYIFGNGGSASTASHFQNDFGKGVSEHVKDKIRMQCLNDNVATVMAVANDIGYDDIFRFQLDGVLDPGDVVIAISGSGNSKNVIKAVEYAKACGNTVIGLTGYSGGKLKELCDISLHVPVNSMQITEDLHMMYDHLMMSVLYKYECGIDHLHH